MIIHLPQTADKLNSQVGNLQASVDIVVRLMFMLRDPDISNGEIANTVVDDKFIASVLVNKLEQMSNKEEGFILFQPEVSIDDGSNKKSQSQSKEPVLSRDQLVEAIEIALMRIGHSEILKLVSGISFGKVLGGELKGYGMARNELWVHSVIVALIAQNIAKLKNTLELEKDENAVTLDSTIAFISGLLHDVGKIALNAELTTKSSVFRGKLDSRSISWIEAEKHICNKDHALAGSELVKKWKLNDDICKAIAGHHTPPPHERLTAVVHLADCAARMIGSAPGIGGFALRTDARALQTLNLKMENLEQVVMFVASDQETIANYCATS
jgi:putative nucleotidyltransferase with HDIG domain